MRLAVAALSIGRWSIGGIYNYTVRSGPEADRIDGWGVSCDAIRNHIGILSGDSINSIQLIKKVSFNNFVLEGTTHKNIRIILLNVNNYKAVYY